VAALAAVLLGSCRTEPRPKPAAPAAERAAARPFESPFDRARLAPVRLERVSRPGVRTAPRESLRKSVHVVPGSRLDLAMGLVCPSGRPCRGGGRFTVVARRGGTRETLLEREAAASGASSGWHEAALPLDRFTEGPIEIVLSYEARGSDAPEGPAPVFAEPTVHRARTSDRPNVLLVSGDTLRADHLGSHGYRRPTSPRLDALAKTAVRFSRAYAQSPWTTPSHVSMLTGLYPSGHRVNQSFTELARFLGGRGGYRLLSPRVETLAEILRREGYRTLARTGGVGVDSTLGFDRGFDVYENDTELDPGTFSRLTGWLDAYGDAPWFLFLHTYEVHAPYKRTDLASAVLSEEQRAEIDRMRSEGRIGGSGLFESHLRSRGLLRRDVTEALYDGGILFMDGFFGRLLDELRRRGLDERTIVVFTSDHGEEFADHHPDRFYDSHCSPVYDELLHVPLIVRVPGRFAPRTVADPVESVDIVPTLLQLLGIRVPETVQGESLVGLMRGGKAPSTWTLSEATCEGPEMKALREGRHKLVVASPPGGERSGLAAVSERWLFDLRRDPGERTNLVERDAARARAMEERLLSVLARVTASPDGVAARHPGDAVGDELRERLRALGYVE
jgi:arylsulfatase A-like enzyme